ncbi:MULTISPECIES: zinc-binding dehydrogenase [unclassified Streptomyces]|uniref:zinc-binding dehydrogenase n=1 Tax=unclassified Streptomyces TaxID=2593676 RepID=UPI00081E25E8|nr:MULTISPECIES: zinc-binding dehydrogenase [unclassified Streptomyces]MYZ35139.1 zinc-binding dehydrogenase [Streptomyces sp. SID4917]SCF73015.1 NADPH:quinone reductase [Streptomyces sp. MnatMP-M17]
MRALVVDHHAPGRLAFRAVPDPVPGPDEVLVKVAATSLNYGELPQSDEVPTGTVPGWDAAGTVEQAAASGAGPKPGNRVVTWGWGGGWAELRAVNVGELAVLPDGVDFVQAAALPVAGLTALRALRRAEVRPGLRVAVTGASGGVGHFAVQLAHLAGAEVYALVGSPARGEGLTALGADHVLTDPAQIDTPVDIVLDNVGGPLLTDLLGHLAEGALVVSIGAASSRPTSVPAYKLVEGRITLTGFREGGNSAADLAHLAGLLGDGRLRAWADRVTDWESASESAAALLSRQVRGKAVLTIG